VQEEDEPQVWGGAGECGMGHDIWRVFEDSEMPPGTNHIYFTGVIHTEGTWEDHNAVTIEMRDQYQRLLDMKVYHANEEGQQNVFLDSEYSPEFNGDVTVRIMNNLDQDVNDESIGYSDLSFGYEFDPEITDCYEPEGFPTRSPADYDYDKSTPTALWDNNCDATKRQCNGFDYYGGAGECGNGHHFTRVFSA